jgi:DNA-binding GntR family transcriptional regulator
MTALTASTKEPAQLPLVERAYQEVRSRILENLWPPGYTALEQEVALALGMSRTPVREALIRLHQEGLIELAPRRGMRVLPVSAKDMREIYEIFMSLECTAAELLAKRKPSLAELSPLVEATKNMEIALSRDDLDAWAKADEVFHEALVRLAGNKLLHDAMMGFWDRAHRARMVTLRLRPKPVNSTYEHMQLVECLAAGDAAKAAQVNRLHRERASRELLAIFERYQLAQM